VTALDTVPGAPPPVTAGLDLQAFLAEYERAVPDGVVHVEREVDARHEAAAIAVKVEEAYQDSPILVFHRVRTTAGEIAPFPLVMNLFASRARCAQVLGSEVATAGRALYERLKNRVPPVTVARDAAPVQDVVQLGDAADLTQVPAIVHSAWDPGPYVSAGFLTMYEAESGVDNCALQRAWIAGPRELRCFLAKQSHNAHILQTNEARGLPTRAAYWVGHHPAAYLGSGVRLRYPESHWASAGAVLGAPLRLAPSVSLGDDFLVPADAEFVIEGTIEPGDRAPEGPFGEYTRYFGAQRWSPVLRVTAVTHRRNAHWLTIIPGRGDEGRGLAGLRREGTIFNIVSQVVPTVVNVYRPPSCPDHIYIQIHKTNDAQPRHAILAAIASPDAIKHVFVFDEDVNIFDDADVLWAMGTRSQWDRDIIAVPDLLATPLDPSTEGRERGTRGGMDCTKPAPPGHYEQRFFLPPDVVERVDLGGVLPPGFRAGRA
jgi:2,5-furandicarboxylate decarboxylase 1